MIKIRVWFYTTIYIYTCIRILYKYFIYFQVKFFVILTMNFWKCLRAIYTCTIKKRFILIPTGVIKFLPAFTKGKGREFLALISM